MGEAARETKYTCSILVALTILSFGTASFAIDKNKHLSQLVSQNWQIEDGLPQNSIRSLAQTRDGYIWMGSLEGLVRFDGIRFTVFNSETVEGFPHPRVTALEEGFDGSLWISTDEGVARYQDGVFSFFGVEQGLSDQRILDIVEDSKGVLYAASFEGEIFRKSPMEERFSTYGKKISQGISYHALAIDSKNNIWVATNDGLMLMGPDKTVRYGVGDGLPEKDIICLYVDTKDQLWVGTKRGFLRWDKGPHELFELNDSVQDILEDRDGNLWVSSGGGLFRKRGSDVVRYGVEDGLSGNSVEALLEDREGNLWVGSFDKGLDRFSEGKLYTITRRQGIPTDNVWTVWGDSEDRLWFGTSDGIAYMEGGEISAFDPSNEPIEGSVLGTLKDRSGVIWFGTVNRGLGRIENGVVEYLHEDEGFPSDSLRSLYEDDSGVLWIGTPGLGLFSYEGGVFTNYTVEDGLSHKRVLAIEGDGQGGVLFGTQEGLNILADGTLSLLPGQRRDKLPAVYDIEVDDEGAIWVATRKGGIGLYEDSTVRFLKKKDGLPFEGLYSIVDDRAGSLWFSGNKGLGRIDKQQARDFFDNKVSRVEADYFGKEDGMKSRECNGGVQSTAFRDSNGLLYFTNIMGVVVVDPASIRKNDLPPPVHVETSLVDSREIAPGEVLPPGSARFEFQYTGLSYYAPEKVTFKYKLVGFDKRWIDAGTERFARYTNLSPGEYTFKVKACNSDGVWSEDEATFTFSLEPRFYETNWFLGLAGVLLIGLGALAFGLRARFVKRRQQKLSELAWTRTKESLERQVSKVRGVTSEIGDVSAGMSSLVADLAKVAHLVSGSVSHTATEIEQLRVIGKHSEDQAARIADSSAQVRDTALDGRKSVDDSKRALGEMQQEALAIDSMTQDLLQRLGKVDLVIGSLASTAEQSQVLAINGAIESASAGEFGAGFSVVSKAMAELAVESKKATQEVTSLLTHVVKSIQDIAKTARSSKLKMEKNLAMSEHSKAIVEDLGHAVATNNSLADEIALNISEQAKGLGGISTEISRIDGTSKQNTHVSAELETSAARLTEMVELLKEIMDEWKTPDMGR